MYGLITTPNPILADTAAPVKKFDSKLHEIIRNMEETLLATDDPKGVGLAAPQVGIPLRIFQMRPQENGPVTTYINPVVEQISQELNDDIRQSERLAKAKATGKIPAPKGKKMLEGCLSIPNIWGYVSRSKEVKLSWQDETGKKRTKVFKGFSAVIVQHELDHLNGVLFTKHVIEQGEKLYKSHKNEEGEDEFEEIKI